MKTAKDEVRRLLEELPDDASLEQIQYHIYVRQKLERALTDEKNGRILPQAEVEERMSRWLEQ